MARDVVSLSSEQIVEHVLRHVNEAGAAGPLQHLTVGFAEDADEQWALFLTALVRGDEELAEEQLVRLTSAIHEAARRLDLGMPWYVRVQDEGALVEDPAE